MLVLLINRQQTRWHLPQPRLQSVWEERPKMRDLDVYRHRCRVAAVAAYLQALNETSLPVTLEPYVCRATEAVGEAQQVLDELQSAMTKFQSANAESSESSTEAEKSAENITMP